MLIVLCGHQKFKREPKKLLLVVNFTIFSLHLSTTVKINALFVILKEPHLFAQIIVLIKNVLNPTIIFLVPMSLEKLASKILVKYFV